MYSGLEPLDRMVGVTGIEPVTPTMSTKLPYLNTAEKREQSTSRMDVSGMKSGFVLVSEVRRTEGNYVHRKSA